MCQVTDPSGNVYWGNKGLKKNMWSTSGGKANTIDTVENVQVLNPAAGIWLVEVIASEINQDTHVETGATDADYALVVSGVDMGNSCPARMPIAASEVNATCRQDAR